MAVLAIKIFYAEVDVFKACLPADPEKIEEVQG